MEFFYGIKALALVIQKAESWFNLNPAHYETGDHLAIERNGQHIRIASVAPDDVVIVFRNGRWE